MTKLPSPCSQRTCSEIVTARYCDEHQPEKWEDDSRPGFRERGYSSAWTKLSRLYRQEHPVCERCDERGDTTPSALVHHKRPIQEGGALLDKGNLEALCMPCHNAEHGAGT